MLAAKLRHRIDIEALTVGLDSNGIQVEEWATIRDSNEPDLIPAEMVPLSGREFLAAQATQAGITTRFTIRFRDGLIPSMRIAHDGLYYNIRAILPDPSLRRHMTIMTESGVNEG